MSTVWRITRGDGLTVLVYSFPLDRCRYATIEIPAEPLTQEDVDRLSAFIATLAEGGDEE